MNMRIIVSLILLVYSVQLFGCSCEGIFYCEAYHLDSAKISFRGVVYENKIYTGNTNAVYVKLLDIYDDDFGLTDTIKLFGGPNESSCDFNVISRLRIGDTLRVVITTDWRPRFDPDSGKENFYTNELHFCTIKHLYEVGDSIKGHIHIIETDTSVEWITSVSKKEFQEKLEDCSFVTKTREVYGSPKVVVSPNPTLSNRVRMVFRDNEVLGLKIKVISPNGKSSKSPYKIIGKNEIELSKLVRGLNIIIIDTGHEKLVQRVLSI